MNKNLNGEDELLRSSQRLSKLVSRRDYNAEEKDTSLIVGLVLGGGTIKNATLSKETKKYEQLKYVKELFEKNGYKCELNKVNEYREQWGLKVRLSPEVAKHYRHQFYPNGNKTVTRHLLNELTNDGLVIWILLNSHNVDGGLALGTLKFTEEENKIIQNYFKVVHKLEPRLHTSHGKIIVYLPYEDKEELFNKVCVPRSILLSKG